MVVFAAGLAVAFGLNRFPIFESGLAGDADGAGVAVGDAPSFLRAWCSAGEVDAAGLAAGETSAFLCPRVFAGDSEASGLALGEIGLCAPTRETPARIIIDTSRARFVVMNAG